MNKKSRNTTLKRAEGLKASIAGKARHRAKRQRALRDIESCARAPRNDLTPSLRIVSVPVDELRPAERRVRKMDPAQLAKVKASIGRFGVCAPLLIDKERRIVVGHSLWEAARALGIPELRCAVVEHLGSNDLRLLRITLNRLAETGSWDMEALKLEFEELEIIEEDLVITGFEMAEVDMILLDDDAEPQIEGHDVLPALPSHSTSRLGDVWLLGDHILLQGDARDPSSYDQIMGPNDTARLLLTDVPYNVPNVGHVTGQAQHREFAMAAGEMTASEFGEFNAAWMGAAAARIAEGGLIGTTIDWRSVELVISAGKRLGFELMNVVVWVKSNAGQGSLWRSQHEFLPIFKKGGAPHINNVALGRHGRWRSNVWHYPGASSLGSDARDGLAHHPTVKPRAMLEDALLDISNRGDLVIDCFAGSGSMLLAAEAVDRRCQAIEIDGPYCDVAIRRWEAMTGDSAVLRETGESFAAVSERRLGEAANGEEGA
jgi:DNA modification methylase